VDQGQSRKPELTGITHAPVRTGAWIIIGGFHQGAGNVGNIKTFKGMTIEDSPGYFEWIDKNSLEIDEDYQRRSRENHYLKIAENWSWMSCGTLHVARRLGQGDFVFNGAHRVMAARQIESITELPCIVFNTIDSKIESKAFLIGNENTKHVMPIESFRAKIHSGVPEALFVQELLSGTDYKVSTSVHERVDRKIIMCIGTLLDTAKTKPDALKRIWPLIVEICGNGVIYKKVIVPLCYMEHKIYPLGYTLCDDPWRHRLIELGPHGIMKAAKRGEQFLSISGAQAQAIGIANVLNKGLRKRLPIKESE
jgi:hypothetical protein